MTWDRDAPSMSGDSGVDARSDRLGASFHVLIKTLKRPSACGALSKATH